jgi:hypothetical protein
MSFSELEQPVTHASEKPPQGVTDAASQPLGARTPLELDPFVMADPFAPTPAVERLEAAALEPTTRGAGIFERYQKLLAQSAGILDQESAILAAVDSALLAAPASSTSSIAPLTTSEPAELALEELPPPRPRLLSFHFERDVDWSDEAAAPAARVELDQPANQTPSPPAIEPAEPEPAVAAPPAPQAQHPRSLRDAPGWSAFWGGLACALSVGFGLGFVAGHERPATLVAETPSAQAASTSEPKVSSAVVDSLAASAPAEPLLPGPEPSAGEEAPSPASAALASTPSAAPAPAPPGPAMAPSAAASAQLKLPNMEFDSKSALAALGKAAGRAGVCVPPGEPGGSVVATVTFAPNGRASSAALSGAQFSGTYSSECIRKLLTEVKVRPFLGDPVTVRKTLTIH